MIKPIELIHKYYNQFPLAEQVLLQHSRSVAQKALEISRNHPELALNDPFLAEASLLHDIGICFVHAPSIGCFGTAQYIEHGYLGAQLLLKEGLPRHALVCERHTGTGLSLQTIISQNLPLPHREMVPITLEEQVICFADLFFTKSHVEITREVGAIRKALEKRGEEGVNKFDQWCALFL